MLSSQKAMVRNALDTGRPESALQNLRSMLRQYPKDSEIHNLMGLTQLGLKNPARATQHFMTAYKIDNKPATALNLSSAYLEGGDFNKAIKVLNVMLKNTGNDSYPYRERVFHNLGYAHLRLGDLSKARGYFTNALTENPTFYPSHMELARLFEKTKRPALAAKSYRQAIDYCDVCLEPVEALARVYMKLGKVVDARRTLLRYTKIEGVSPADRGRVNRLLRLSATPPAGRRKG